MVSFVSAVLTHVNEWLATSVSTGILKNCIKNPKCYTRVTLEMLTTQAITTHGTVVQKASKSKTSWCRLMSESWSTFWGICTAYCMLSKCSYSLRTCSFCSELLACINTAVKEWQYKAEYLWISKMAQLDLSSWNTPNQFNFHSVKWNWIQ